MPTKVDWPTKGKDGRLSIRATELEWAALLTLAHYGTIDIAGFIEQARQQEGAFDLSKLSAYQRLRMDHFMRCTLLLRKMQPLERTKRIGQYSDMAMMTMRASDAMWESFTALCSAGMESLWSLGEEGYRTLGESDPPELAVYEQAAQDGANLYWRLNYRFPSSIAARHDPLRIDHRL